MSWQRRENINMHGKANDPIFRMTGIERLASGSEGKSVSVGYPDTLAVICTYKLHISCTM